MSTDKPAIKPGQILTTSEELVAGIYATEEKHGTYLSVSFGPGWARGTLVDPDEPKHEPSDANQG